MMVSRCSLFLAPADLSVLAEIDAMRDRLRLHLTAARRWQGQLGRNLAARAIAGSNSIEDYVASVEDVEDIMAGEAPVDAIESVAVEIEGYRQAMSLIQRLGDAEPDFSYSKGLLNALHFMMQGHHPVKRPGWWRDGPVYVKDAELGEQQALRDIRDLVRAGWLEARGEAQARRYVGASWFPGEIREIANQPRTLRDPLQRARARRKYLRHICRRSLCLAVAAWVGRR